MKATTASSVFILPTVSLSASTSGFASASASAFAPVSVVILVAALHITVSKAFPRLPCHYFSGIYTILGKSSHHQSCQRKDRQWYTYRMYSSTNNHSLSKKTNPTMFLSIRGRLPSTQKTKTLITRYILFFVRPIFVACKISPHAIMYVWHWMAA